MGSTALKILLSYKSEAMKSVKVMVPHCREFCISSLAHASNLFAYAVMLGALLATVQPAYLPISGSGASSQTEDMPATHLRRAYEVKSLPGYDGQFPSQNYSGRTCSSVLGLCFPLGTTGRQKAVLMVASDFACTNFPVL